MRKVICLILALIFCLALACPAFAATVSNSKEDVEDCGDGNHKYNGNGVCTVCGDVCDHNYVNGKCTICGKTKTSSSGIPATGDMIMPWIGAMVVSAGALGAVVVEERKKHI